MYYTDELAKEKEYFSRHIPKIIKEELDVEKCVFISDAFHPNYIWLKITALHNDIPFVWELKIKHQLVSRCSSDKLGFGTPKVLLTFDLYEFDKNVQAMEDKIFSEIEIIKDLLDS